MTFLEIYAISCAGTVGIKHRHNLVRDTLLDICFQADISAGKEVDIGLVDVHDKSLRPADLILNSWDMERDVCVDLTGSSPLTQTGMTEFMSGQAIVDAARHKCAKYRDLCGAAGYGFLPFSFSSLGELDSDAVVLLKRIQTLSASYDAGVRMSAYIFPRHSFAISKGAGTQIVSRLPTNFV